MCPRFDGLQNIKKKKHARNIHPGWSPQYTLLPINDPAAKRQYDPRVSATPPVPKRREEVSLRHGIEDLEMLDYIRTETQPHRRKEKRRKVSSSTDQRMNIVKITNLSDTDTEDADEGRPIPQKPRPRRAAPQRREELNLSDSDSGETVILPPPRPQTYIDMPRVSMSAETVCIPDENNNKTLKEDLQLSQSSDSEPEEWVEVQELRH